MKKLINTLILAFIVLTAFPQSQDEICPILPDAEIPSVSVTNLEGEEIDLKEVTSKGKYIIVFFRGGWCPYCRKHLSALGENLEEIKELGYEIIAISTDDLEHSKETISKLELDYTIYSDDDMEASKAFGIAFTVDEKTRSRYKTFGIDLEEASGHQHNMLPVPSVIITDKGEVQWTYVNPNYKERLDSEILMAILRNS